jgi:hypothetical protein
MAKYSFVVLTNSVSGREAEFNEWYDNVHMKDVLALPGFISAKRYVTAGAGDLPTTGHSYLAIYEIETDDLAAVNAALAKASGTPALSMSETLDRTSVSRGYFKPLSPPG